MEFQGLQQISVTPRVSATPLRNPLAQPLAGAAVSALESRANILRLQSAMLDLNGGADGLDDFPLTHHFAPGVYGRQMLIPAGSVIVGKIHKHSHLNIVVSGHCWVATETGRKELHGGDVFVSEPGTKRAVTAIVDTVWITIHPNETDTRDLRAIEDYVIAPTYEALEGQSMIEVTA